MPWFNPFIKTGGGGGTSDYADLNNKPSINDIVLEGNKTLSELGIARADDTYTEAEINNLLLGKADLENGKIPASQLPSYVDDVLEYEDMSTFPLSGETGKIYIARDTNKTYRWSGTTYVEISESLALGETSSFSKSNKDGGGRAEWTKITF